MAELSMTNSQTIQTAPSDCPGRRSTRDAFALLVSVTLVSGVNDDRTFLLPRYGGGYTR